MHETAQDEHSYLLGTGKGFLCDFQTLQVKWDTHTWGGAGAPHPIDFNLSSGLRITNNSDPIKVDMFNGRPLFLCAVRETLNQIQLAELLIAQHTIIITQHRFSSNTACVALMTHDKRIPLRMRTILREMMGEMECGRHNMSSRSIRLLLRERQNMIENMRNIDQEEEDIEC